MEPWRSGHPRLQSDLLASVSYDVLRDLGDVIGVRERVDIRRLPKALAAKKPKFMSRILGAYCKVSTAACQPERDYVGISYLHRCALRERLHVDPIGPNALRDWPHRSPTWRSHSSSARLRRGEQFDREGSPEYGSARGCLATSARVCPAAPDERLAPRRGSSPGVAERNPSAARALRYVPLRSRFSS